MLLSSLTKFLASLLSAALLVAIVTMTVDSTLLSSHYIESQLASTNSYNKLSTALSDELRASVVAANPNVPPAAAAIAAGQLQGIFTPDLIKSKLNSAVEVLEAYLRGSLQLPTIDMRDVVARAQAAGVPIPPDNSLSKPVAIISTTNNNVQNVRRTFEHVKLSAIILSVVLVGALLALSWERHRFATLPDVAIVLGVLVGLVAVGLSLAPGLLDSHLKLDLSSNAFAGIGHDLIRSIIQDMGKRFMVYAVVLLVVGIAGRIVVARLKPPKLST
ncbi:MAG: hypothetical protein WC498_04265 [Candidatus Saccharimonadales bacterium]